MAKNPLQNALREAIEKLAKFTASPDKDMWSRLEELRGLTVDVTIAARNFYDGKMNALRFFSQAVRVVGFLLGATAFLGPPVYALINPTGDAVRAALFGSLALGIAAVVLIIDRVLLFTAHWSRNTNAMLRCSHLLMEFAVRWTPITLARSSGNPPSAELTAQALEIVQTHVAALNLAFNTERELWTSQLSGATADLEGFVNNPPSAVKALKETTSAALETSAVRFFVKNQASLKGDVDVSWTGPSEGNATVRDRGVAINLRLGLYEFTAVAFNATGQKVKDYDVVLVTSAVIARIEFELH
jgi:hypothetical protein